MLRDIVANNLEGITMEILEKVKKLIAEQFDAQEDTISEDTAIVDDLGADSLDVVDLVMAISGEFGIEIPDDQVENFKTVGDIVDYLEKNTK